MVFTPPVANTTAQPDTGEAGDENEEPGEGAAEPAYSGEEPAYADEVVFEEVL